MKEMIINEITEKKKKERLKKKKIGKKERKIRKKGRKNRNKRKKEWKVGKERKSKTIKV